MAAFDLEEQEQIATLKAWWDKWGGILTISAVVLAVAVLGWRGWEWRQSTQAADASVVYASLMQAVEAKDAQKIREASGVIAERFGSTAYADLSALLAAEAQAASGDRQSAKSKLEWAAEKGNDALTRDLARLRLAGLLLDEKAYDAALKQLSVKPNKAFAVRYADLRGDVLTAQGKPADALTAYKEALDGMGSEQGSQAMRSVLELKIDALGGGK
ncbi:tetratricopeptide repeat protein [Niveibacterium umoris]|uniref:Ancillary SecYEG translocon subunit n=1 Tax=Niveibacterium umoris TaxID=1193620 RepID=A0A840BPW8_9RHOO|nr:tetratricopeptide repeat protein [Niveibacterium umoris]MBB4012477.1 putative negative regulator of RcsB-dependent stress response [Niveibacterium umoris]